MSFKSLARAHWMRHLPNLVKELKAQGRLEEELDLAASQAQEELARLVSGGAQVAAAREIVLKEYIFLPPETDE